MELVLKDAQGADCFETTTGRDFNEALVHPRLLLLMQLVLVRVLVLRRLVLK